jgi:AFG3 family protein
MIGFENFIPKKKSASQEKKESSSQEGSSHEDGTRKETSQEKPKDSSGGAGSTKEKSNDPFKNFGAGGPFRSQNQESNKGNNSNNNGNIGNGMTSIAVMLLIAYMWNNMAEPGQKHDDSHEIDWKEFIYGLVETDQVDKVVISPQKTSALVFLKPGAQGLSSSRHGLHRISFSQIQQSNDEDPHDTATQQEPDEDVVEGLSSTSNRPIGFSSSAPGHRIVYRLNIGSVDMFERKLQEAQRGLGRSPSQDIPVQFVTESSVANEFFKILPGLMMLGLLFYASRSMLGGSGFGAGSGAGSEGGGGGFGGIFKIGKSTAQKMGKDEIKVRWHCLIT